MVAKMQDLYVGGDAKYNARILCLSFLGVQKRGLPQGSLPPPDRSLLLPLLRLV